MAFSTYSLWEVNRTFLFKFLNYCYVCKINELNLDDEEEQELIAEFINLPKEEKKFVGAFVQKQIETMYFNNLPLL